MDSNNICNKKHLFLEGLSPKGGAFLATAIAEALSEGLDPIQLATLSAFLIAIGDTMAYIAAQTELNSEVFSRSSGPALPPC